MTSISPSWIQDILSDPAAIEALSGGLSPKEILGCGHFGCVVATEDPNKVIKITRDPTEAPVVKLLMDLQEKGDLSGFVHFYSVERLTEIKVWGRLWPVHVIVREAVIPWSDTDPPFYGRVAISDKLAAYSDLADKWWFIPDSDDSGRDQLRRNIGMSLQDMAQTANLAFIADGLGELLAEGYPPLADVHSSNIGWREDGNLAIFDPGHTHLSRPPVPNISSDFILPELLDEVGEDLDTEIKAALEIEYRKLQEDIDEELPPFDEWVLDINWEFDAEEIIDNAAGSSFLPLSPAFGLSPFPRNEIELDWMEAIIDWLELLGPNYRDVFGSEDVSALQSVLQIGYQLQERRDILPTPLNPQLPDARAINTLREYLRELRLLHEKELLTEAVAIFMDNHQKTQPTPLPSLVGQAYYGWLALIEEWKAMYFPMP